MIFTRRTLAAALLSTAALILPAQGLLAEEWPAPIRAVEAKGVRIVGAFDAPDGLKGFAGQFHNQPVALYLTPGGQHVLVGSLLDAKGEDLSQAPLDRLVSQPQDAQTWAALEKTRWIADGSASAPRIVYVFSDPNCPYCTMFWNQSRPWVDAGKVQLRHILVGIIREDSAAKAAALLADNNPEKALHDHEQAGKSSPLKGLQKIPADLQASLDANLALMQSLDASGTPAIFFHDENGKLQVQQGAPRPDVLAKILGPK